MRLPSLWRIVVVVLAAVALFLVAGLGVGQSLGRTQPLGAGGRPPGAPNAVPAGGDQLGKAIVGVQNQLRSNPDNATALATLGLDYVQQAKITVDPSYYPKAQGVLDRSLQLQPTGNFLADGGQAALASARHDFLAARGWAQKGLAIDPYNAPLYGALDDAETQLGDYPQAFAAVQKMLDVRPGTPAFTRAEYVFELRGQVSQARTAMRQALNDAASPADEAFTHYYLGQLSFDNGDPAAALTEIGLGLRADPAYPALIEGRAKAEAALGQTDAALRDYAAIVARVPQPSYVLDYGELLQSLGRTAEAKAQYAVFDAENRLFAANGVAQDVDPTLFEANHGDPATALRDAKVGIKIRPFLEMDDAYAWALHVNHLDSQALGWATKALALGTRNALFHYHRGMIEFALGDRATARSELTTAFGINPHFNPLLVPQARATLKSLGGGG